MAFRLESKNDNYHLLTVDMDYYLIEGDGYDIYSFRDILKIDNIQLIEDKILSYGAKCYQDSKFIIYYYFEDKEQGQKLVDEFNIILKLAGD